MRNIAFNDVKKKKRETHRDYKIIHTGNDVGPDIVRRCRRRPRLCFIIVIRVLLRFMALPARPRRTQDRRDRVRAWVSAAVAVAFSGPSKPAGGIEFCGRDFSGALVTRFFSFFFIFT